MRVAPLRRLTALTRITPLTAGMAGLAGLSALSLAAPTGAAAAQEQVLEAQKIVITPAGADGGDAGRVVVIGGEDGRPVVIRVADDSDRDGNAKADKPENSADSGDDIVRRMRERRRAEESAGKAGLRDRGNRDGSAPDAQRENRENRDNRERQDQLERAQRRAEDAQRQDQEKNPRAAQAEKVTFLGINPGPVPPVLARQLKLPAEVGLVVEQVLPGSPADHAGLKQYDVLQKMDDQVLIDPHQLVVLVHGHKAGDTVTLSGIREGQPFTAKVTLAGREAQGDIEINEGNEPQLRYHIVPPAPPTPSNPLKPFGGQGGPNGPNGPRSWRPEPPTVIPLPLAPGEAVPPAPRGERPDRKPEANPQPKPEQKPKPEAKPGERREGGEQGRAEEERDAEVHALEQQLRELRSTAEKLRAEVRAREQQGRPQRDEAQRDQEK